MSCNMRNTGNRKDNSSGAKGIYWNKKDKKWMARININNKIKYIGSYNDLNEAVLARSSAEQYFNWADYGLNDPALIQKGRCYFA